jgi:hypothetical protein
MAMAGSLANVVVESSFHMVDTVNINAKASEHHIGSFKMVEQIYNKEGIRGFGKGFSAMYYGSIACGFIYFSMYKVLKHYFSNLFGPNKSIAWTFFCASFVAEFFTLIVYYPFDLIKARL